MRICQSHWDKLRAAIEDRGLAHLVSGSGKKAADQAVAQLQGDNSNSTYDPLMAANFAIWSNALDAFGLAMMQENAPCPLCLMDDHAKNCTDAKCKKESASDWIRYAADGQLEVARDRGLLWSHHEVEHPLP